MNKMLSREEAITVLKVEGVNFVLTRHFEGKITWHNQTETVIREAVNKVVWDNDFNSFEFPKFNDNGILDIVDLVNKYVRFNDTLLKSDYRIVEVF